MFKFNLFKNNSKFASIDKDSNITAISDHDFQIDEQVTRGIGLADIININKPLKNNSVAKDISELRIAVVCNWLDKCGISTYSKYLVDAIRPKVKEVRIFSEQGLSKTGEDTPDVDRCWKRGEPLIELSEKIKAWNPDFIIIQHEFGIFPNLFYFMQFMQQIERIPYIVTLHSVYEHLDKIVYCNVIKNIVVHSQQSKDLLVRNGVNSNISVVPHGCVSFDNVEPLWNLCLNPYTIMQFGFGFAYKGVERALDAIYILKTTDPKFANIFYFYLLSDNDYNSRGHLEYYNKLLDKVKELKLENNIAFVRKYQTDQMLNLYLRLAKIAIFPYLNNTGNVVYGASGAIRIAMANKIPVIASENHLFDDLEGIVARPTTAIDLAREIDEIFSNGDKREQLIARTGNFIANNSWDLTSDLYLKLYTQT